MKDEVVRLPRGLFFLRGGSKGCKLLPYRRRRGYLLEQHVMFRRLLDEKLKAGEILLPEGGIANIHEAPSLRHQDRRKSCNDALPLDSRSRVGTTRGRDKYKHDGSTGTKFV